MKFPGKIKLRGAFLLLISSFAYPANPIVDSVLQYKLDSLFSLDTKETFCTVIDRPSPVYFASTFRTVNLPYYQVIDAVRDFRWIANSINIVKTFNQIQLGPNLSPKGTFNFEVKIGLVRGWCLLDLDTLIIDSFSSYKLVFKGNDDPVLNDIWKNYHRGWFITKSNNVYVKIIINKISDNTTRLGYVSWLTPQRYVPHWLYMLAADIAIPGVLNDLEKALLMKYKQVLSVQLSPHCSSYASQSSLLSTMFYEQP